MIRFADNNLKNLAMAIAIIISCIVSIPLFDFQLNQVFAGGGSLVIASIFLYAWEPKPKLGSAYLPVTTPGSPGGAATPK